MRNPGVQYNRGLVDSWILCPLTINVEDLMTWKLFVMCHKVEKAGYKTVFIISHLEYLQIHESAIRRVYQNVNSN